MDNIIKLSEYRNFSLNKDDDQNTDLTSKQIKKLENSWNCFQVADFEFFPLKKTKKCFEKT